MQPKIVNFASTSLEYYNRFFCASGVRRCGKFKSNPCEATAPNIFGCETKTLKRVVDTPKAFSLCVVRACFKYVCIPMSLTLHFVCNICKYNFGLMHRWRSDIERYIFCYRNSDRKLRRIYDEKITF